MKDLIKKGTGNSRYLKSVADFKQRYPTYDDFVQALVAGTLPIDLNGINPDGITQLGTSLSKVNLLQDSTATSLGMTVSASTDPTVDGAFQAVMNGIGDVEATLRSEINDVRRDYESKKNSTFQKLMTGRLL